jgi:hypothetical protein
VSVVFSRVCRSKKRKQSKGKGSNVLLLEGIHTSKTTGPLASP